MKATYTLQLTKYDHWVERHIPTVESTINKGVTVFIKQFAKIPNVLYLPLQCTQGKDAEMLTRLHGKFPFLRVCLGEHKRTIELRYTETDVDLFIGMHPEFVDVVRNTTALVTYGCTITNFTPARDELRIAQIPSMAIPEDHVNDTFSRCTGWVENLDEKDEEFRYAGTPAVLMLGTICEMLNRVRDCTFNAIITVCNDEKLLKRFKANQSRYDAVIRRNGGHDPVGPADRNGKRMAYGVLYHNTNKGYQAYLDACVSSFAIDTINTPPDIDAADARAYDL